MRNVFYHWDEFEKKLSNKYIMLFLDYDGTISPIAGTPDKAVISRKTRQLLKKLSVHPRRKVAIISGRALKDIQNKIGLKSVIYAGNHGLEIEGPKVKFRHRPAPEYRAIIRNIDNGLKRELRGIKGVLIENKAICLSLHYRLARIKDVPRIKAIFKAVTLPYVVSEKVKISAGKKMLEVRPPVSWNKGSVAMWLLARQRVFLRGKSITPIYIGDDLTDEDAFRALAKSGITVFVGKSGLSGAKYYLKNTGEVIKFLTLMARSPHP